MTVQTDILIEPLSEGRIRVSGLGRFSLSAEGATRDEAMRRFRVDQWQNAVEERRKQIDAELEASFEASQEVAKP